MSCATFRGWLDEGCPAAGASEAAAHAERCASCAAQLRAERALSKALSVATLAPDRFSDRVMARIQAPTPVASPPALPWWIRAATEPATVAAMAAGALLSWGWEGWWTTASALGILTGQAVSGFPASLDANVLLALQVAAGSLLALAAPALARAVSRLPMTRA